MSNSHINSKLLMKGRPIPVDDPSSATWSFNKNLVSSGTTMYPLDTNGAEDTDNYISSTSGILVPGRFGNGLQVAESTTNLINPKASWALMSGLSTSWRLDILDEYTIKITALIDNPTVSTWNDIANFSSTSTTNANVTVTYSCEIVDRSTTNIFPSTGGWGTIEGYSQYGNRVARTITHTASWAHNFTIRTANVASIKAGDFLTIRKVQLEQKAYGTSFADTTRTELGLKYKGYPVKTFSCWVKSVSNKVSTGPADQRTLVYQPNLLDTYPMWSLYVAKSGENTAIEGLTGVQQGNAVLLLELSAMTACYVPNIKIDDGNWHNVTVEHGITSGSNVISRLWVDGVSAQTAEYVAKAFDGAIRIGFKESTDPGSNFIYDEMRIDRRNYVNDDIIRRYIANAEYFNPYSYGSTC